MNTLSIGIGVFSVELYIMIGRHIAYFWYIEKTSAKSKLPMQSPAPSRQTAPSRKGLYMCTSLPPHLLK